MSINFPPGWSSARLNKLSEEEHRLWMAGKCADSVQRAGNQNQTKEAPGYIPAGWSTEQAISPTFDRIRPAPAELDPSSTPSPLVQTLQRDGYPTWGFVIVRTYYASEERWQAFQEMLDILCDSQLDEETGDGLQDIKDKLEFKMIEDPRLRDASMVEARKHFHIARDMGGVVAGLGLGILLLVDKDVVESFVGGKGSPYLLAVDVDEAAQTDDTGL
ncbi:hypothetical protein GGS20DRAFT_588041 [Poronia punctata]|nr:hypothetical protein GGS20DRAFT_588041 [Poronia punctata]